MDDNITWVNSLSESVKCFLESQKSDTIQGYYAYSESGDLYSEKYRWNVGSSCFALKLLYTLGVESKKEVQSTLDYILGFVKDDCLIYDDFVVKKSFAKNFASSIIHKRFNNLLHQDYKRAETRQCLSALSLYDAIPSDFKIECPSSEDEVNSFLKSLNWNLPWAAGSHFSHLLFFIKTKHNLGQISDSNYLRLVEYTVDWIDERQLPQTGGWGTGNIDARNIINGAMKVMTGLQNVDVIQYSNAELLIDTCLSYTKAGHACDNFNIVYVLNKLSASLSHGYRFDEISSFMLSKLGTYREHFKPKSGGFSFYKDSSNTHYYGLKITKGRNEADIHGTVLFLWGICLISDTLDLKTGLREFVT
ncbi:hypothetical protein F0266_16385 [Vibrio coralliilyticus]|uniref:hypothetical protein n=1 Tax=Vibrio coralliilyticus TaxID=190893 RepID=UPI00148E72F0|nr:hypothetical protein [Vibrio coralliilyticus]NOH54520.1 hypothetical protein [Vibrio coralliilyticus]